MHEQPYRKPRPTRMREADRIVAERLRVARRLVHVSQETVSRALGVSCQQVHKYEKATNAVTPGILAVYAKLTGQRIAWFFEAEHVEAAEPAHG